MSNPSKRIVLGLGRFLLRLLKGLTRVAAVTAGISMLMLVLDTVLLGNAERPDTPR